MRSTRTLIYAWLALASLTACTLPSQRATPGAGLPAQPTRTSSAPATAPGVDAPPRLNQRDASSIAAWIDYAVKAHDPAPILQMLRAGRFAYANYIEGGQDVSHKEFETDLAQRIPSNAKCVGYNVDSSLMQVWVEGWNPDWELRETCYIDCNVYDPPLKSDMSGFIFKNNNGVWELFGLYLNTPDNYYFADQALVACGQKAPAPAPTATRRPTSTPGSCPGAPPQRLQVGKRAEVCTLRDSVFLRSGPARHFDPLRSYNPGSELNVIGGPVCSDGWSWWMVQDGRSEGWMSEGGDSIDRYFLCPAP